MSSPTKITVFGRNHELKRDIHIQSLEDAKIALGTSTGITSKPNEDCIGVSILGQEYVIAIADGHWGRDASEIAVSKSVELIGSEVHMPSDSKIRARLFDLNEQVNAELYDRAMSAPGASESETTLIVCHIRETESGRYLHWSSIGDSFLFFLRNGDLKQLNTLKANWLGYLSGLSERSEPRSIVMQFLENETRFGSVANGLETGIEKLEINDLLFLCTDGLTGSDTDPEISVLNEFKSILAAEMTLVSKIKALISSALTRGETDNISCVIAQIE